MWEFAFGDLPGLTIPGTHDPGSAAGRFIDQIIEALFWLGGTATCPGECLEVLTTVVRITT